MQATSTIGRENDRLIALLTRAGVAGAVILFAVVIGRMGLLGDFGRGSLLAPPADIIVTARQMRFGQEDIHLKVGQTVAILLENQDLFAHSFDVDEFDVHVAMPQNQEVFATFTATRPGLFDFYCGVPGHTEAGMVGKIIVEPR